jgi:hypothetical protein
MVEIADVYGLWERSLLAWPDGRQDTTTLVRWLQGPSLFADLRQPISPPSFAGVSCREDLGRAHFGWLARQEGFAGRLIRAGSAFEWQREIDFQCPASAPDAGYLEFRNGVLVEEGRDSPYIEHWHRNALDLDPHYALCMRDESNRKGYLVRAGRRFMLARARAQALPEGTSLPDLVEAASDEEARALLDCELSLGIVAEHTWRIEGSSLPHRVGADLAPVFSIDGTHVVTTDVESAGAVCLRHWTVVEQEGAFPTNVPQR